jgi:hypothetical protein
MPKQKPQSKRRAKRTKLSPAALAAAVIADTVAATEASTWLSMTVLAKRYKVSRQRVHQILTAAGIAAARVRRPSKPKPEPRKPYAGPCLECDHTGTDRKYTRQRCHNSCYARWRYHNYPGHKEKVLKATTEWMKANPDKVKIIHRKAVAKHRAKLRALKAATGS